MRQRINIEGIETSWNFYTNESIEESFVHDVGRIMNAIENPKRFNGRVACQKGECPVCKRKAAVLGFSPRTNAWMMACPVQVCGLPTMTLHKAIKSFLPTLQEDWSRARWTPTYLVDLLPIRNRKKSVSDSAQETETGSCVERCVAPSWNDSSPLT